MAIVSVSRWKASAEQALPIARQVAPILKGHGATSVRFGPCYSGPDAGCVYVAITFPDWASFGRAQQTLAADAQYQRSYAEALKIGELQDRSLIVAEEL
jgi:hypothetical protein